MDYFQLSKAPHEASGESGGLFDAVRSGFAYGAQQADNVRIRHDRIRDYTLGLKKKKPEELYDASHHFIGAPEETISYVLTAESMNYGSGFEPALRGEGWDLIDNSLYFTVTTRLRDYYRHNGPFSAQDLIGIDQTLIARILKMDMAQPAGNALSELYAHSLRALGHFIKGRGDGLFLNFLALCDGSAETAIRHLISMDNYNDVAFYKGRNVPFYKRAQHTATVLNIECERLNLPGFGDIGQMTMFADNAVPHVLRTDGILEYSDNLAERIARGEDIPAGSEEETEIRACAGHAVELLAQEKNLLPSDIDFILWHRSVEDARYRAAPAHKTRTTFY